MVRRAFVILSSIGRKQNEKTDLWGILDFRLIEV
jgi:hypothetical protein